jgi:hypothetical protein
MRVMQTLLADDASRVPARQRQPAGDVPVRRNAQSHRFILVITSFEPYKSPHSPHAKPQ